MLQLNSSSGVECYQLSYWKIDYWILELSYVSMECLKIILLSIVSMNLLASLVSGNTNLNYGIKTMAMAPSTGRAFEYDSFPTNFDKSSDQHTKGFGVPRIIGVPSSAPISQTQIVVPVDRPEIAIKRQEVSKSKGWSRSVWTSVQK